MERRIPEAFGACKDPCQQVWCQCSLDGSAEENRQRMEVRRLRIRTDPFGTMENTSRRGGSDYGPGNGQSHTRQSAEWTVGLIICFLKARFRKERVFNARKYYFHMIEYIS